MRIDQQLIEKILLVLWNMEDLWLEVAQFPEALKTEPEKLLLHLSNLTDSHHIQLTKNVQGKDQVRLTAEGHLLAEQIHREYVRLKAMKNNIITDRADCDDVERRYDGMDDINVKFE